MSAEQGQSTDRTERQQQLRKLGHDVRTPLGIVCTGLEALKGMREDADSFAEIYETIQRDGIEPLKTIIAELVDVACQQETNDQ